MKKLIRLSFIGAVLFTCIKAQAQVIESVSFTPAKTGVYGTIATKSVTSFAGNLTTQNATGLGHKLTLDTKANYPFSANTALGAFRDVYMPASQAIVSSDTKIGLGGKLLNAENVKITKSQVNLIYGGDVDFNKISSLLAVNGPLNIHNVKMSNPKCDIKWVLLPAYKQSTDYSETNNTATSANYWFAYCDAGGSSGDDTTGGAWETSIEDATLLGTCTAGWDGSSKSTQDTAGTYGESPCMHSENINSGAFTCTNQIIKKCTSSVSYGPELYNANDSPYACCPYTSRTLVGYSADWTNTAKCPNAVRPLAVPVYEYTLGDDIIKPLDCSNHNQQTFRRKFCGFWGGGNNATNMIRNFKHASCTGEDISSYQYCADLYGNTYIENLSNEQICAGIKASNPNITNASNSTFKCIKKGPQINVYKAFRGEKCSDRTPVPNATFDKCTIPDNCPSRCRRLNSYFETTNLKFYDRVCGVSDSGVCGNSQSDQSPDKRSKGPGGSIVYFEQVLSGQILTCKWTE
ncbi:MAG: hypothetical protein II972_03125 [Elusimicrobiaceae bacterium]|nr:hypothetical protein [Elusimicrobiaceae bacterium]